MNYSSRLALPTTHRPRFTSLFPSPFLSDPCALYGRERIPISNLFNSFRTLCTKHPEVVSAPITAGVPFPAIRPSPIPNRAHTRHTRHAGVGLTPIPSTICAQLPSHMGGGPCPTSSLSFAPCASLAGRFVSYAYITIPPTQSSALNIPPHREVQRAPSSRLIK